MIDAGNWLASELFPALVGEGQKYKTPEDLAKAYTNADQFIETLKEENRKLREQAASAKTIDEVLERMSKQNVAPEDDNPPVSGMTPDIVQQLVEKTLEGREVAKSKMDNLLKADSLMKEKFGEKAADVFKQRASTPEKAKILMELAAADPVDFVNMFSGQGSLPSNNMDTGSMNTTSVASTGGDRSKLLAQKSGQLRFVKKILELTGHKISNTSYSKLFLKTPPYILGNKEN